MFKRIIAVAMSVIMISTGVDMTALAAGKNTAVNETNVESNMGTMEIAGTNSVGTILSNTLSEEQVKQQESNGNCIVSVEVEGKRAKVSYAVSEPATLVVGIYDNKGQMLLATGTKEVDSQARETEVVIDIEKMPKYFYVKAFLVESDILNPLCTVYESPNYTKEMQEFFAKTTDDFDQERVYNLDEDKTNNFVVYEEDVEILASQGEVNQLILCDEENSKYVFENIDSSISDTVVGDVLVYGKEEPLIIKVGVVSFDGTTATITGVPAEMEEVFEYVKIDTSCEVLLSEEDGETGAETQTVQRNAEVFGEVNGWVDGEDGFALIGDALEKDFKEEASNGAEIEGSVTLKIGGRCKIYYTGLWEYKYAEIALRLEMESTISVNKGWDKEFKLGDILLGGVGVVTFWVPIYLFVEVEGSVSFSGTMISEFGFSYDSNSGGSCINPLPEIVIECKAEISVYMGVRVAIEVNVLLILSAELDYDIGPKITAAYSKEFLHYNPEEELERHACKNCIDGDIDISFRIGWKLRFCGIEFAGDDLATLDERVGDFYFSFDTLKGGMGECPHKVYRIQIKVLDNQKPVAGATVSARNSGETYTTDEQGMINTFMKPGGEYLTIQKDGYRNSYVSCYFVEPAIKVVNMERPSSAKDDPVEDSDISWDETWIDVEEYIEDEDVSDGDVSDGDISSGDISEGDVSDGDASSGNVSDGDLGEDKPENNAVKKLMLDEYQSIVITEDGSLYLWGANTHGKVGNGTITNCVEPVKVLGNVASVNFEAMDLASAITEDGTLYAWGANESGQIGDGSVYNDGKATPAKVLENVVTVDYRLGEPMGMALTKGGGLYTWGRNYGGQLGHGTNSSDYKPLKILDNVKDQYLGDGTCGAIATDGSLYVWGKYAAIDSMECSAPVKALDDAVWFSSYSNVNSAITEDGSLYRWGYNGRAHVGNGNNVNCLSPVKILDNVVEVKEDSNCVGALTKDGSLYMWGYNYGGQVGNGISSTCFSPIEVLDNVKEFIVADYHNLAITKSNELYVWGKNNGTLGNDSTETCLPPVKILDHVVSVKSINHTKGAITEDGSLYMWGSNNYGQVGNGSKETCTVPTKVLDNVKFFNIVNGMSVAITQDDSLYTWGSDGWGQLGNGSAEANLTPMKIMDNVVLFESSNYTCGAVTKDGSLYMWGYNHRGQIGDGTTENCLAPKKIELGITISENAEAEQLVNTMNSTVLTMAEFLSNNTSSGSNDGNDSSHDGKDNNGGKKVNVYTATFKDKLPGETYNFYVMKTRTGNGDATGDNILYLDQVVADAEGKVKITYIPRKEVADAKIFLSGRMGKYDFVDAVVTVKDQLYTGEELWADVAVTYEGQLLTEGVDYDLCGDYKATQPGEYTLVVRGTGEYQGEQTLTYHIRKYSLDVFGVIFDSNGGSKVETQEVEKGQLAVEPEAPTRENHHFKGWYLNGQLYDFTTPVTDHLTLVAQWEEYSKLAAPKASVPSGSRVNAGKEVSLSADEKATIYYTVDGIVPSKESAVYTQPVVIDKDMIIKAYAVADGYYDSEVAVFTYTVAQDGDAFDTVNPEDVPEEGIPEGIWVGKIADQVYTGKAIKPEVRVYDGTKRLVAGRDYSISYKNNVNAQTDLTNKKAPVAVIKGKGNYTKTLTVAFKILPIDLNTDNIIADDVTVAYNKKVQKKSPAVYYGSKKLSKKDVKVEFVDTSANAYKELGTYPVKLTGQGNFDGERIINLTVTDKIPMTSVKVTKVKEQTYQNGSVIEPKLEISYKKTDLVGGTDYDVTYINNQEIGTATAILTGKGEYAGICRVNFKIVGTDIKKVQMEGLTDKQYTGIAITQELVLTYNGAKLGENDYFVKYSNNINAGTATVTITGKGAFSGMVKKTFKIVPYDLQADSDKALAEIAQNFEVLYAKGGSKPTVDVVYKGRTLTAGRDYTISYKNNNAVTTAATKKMPAFIVKGKGNFKGTLEGSFRIVAKTLNNAKEPVSIAVSDIIYTGKAGKYISKPILTDSNGKTLKAGTDYDKNVKYTLKDGTVLDKTSVVKTRDEITVTVTGTGNYTGTLQATYLVAELDFKKVKINAETQVYTGEAITLDAGDLVVTIGGAPLVYGKDYEIVEGSYKNNVRKGTASVTIKGMGSYGGSKTVKFKIVAKELKQN